MIIIHHQSSMGPLSRAVAMPTGLLHAALPTPNQGSEVDGCKWTLPVR